MQWVEREEADKTEAKLTLARQAVARFPEREACRIALGYALLESGQSEEAVAQLTKALARFPRSARLRVALALSRRAVHDYEGALADADAALAIAPGDRDAQRLGARMRLRVRKREAPARLDAQEAGADPYDLQFMRDFTRAHTAEEVCRFCDGKIAENPANAAAVYFKALTLAKVGRDEEARAMLSLERLVRIWDLPVPNGYPDADAFLAAAAGEIRDNPTLIADPRGKSLRQGRRTRTLQVPGARAVRALLGAFQDCADAYERETASLDEAYLRARPARVRLTAWALVTRGEGHHLPHMHQDAWLSGVFFVAAPRRKDGGRDGPLVLGALDRAEGIANPPWGVRRIEPVPGRVVLFPSYVPHATEPTGSDLERISVAFDVVDADAWRGAAAVISAPDTPSN